MPDHSHNINKPSPTLLENFAEAVLALPRPRKRLIAIGADVALCIISVLAAFYLRLGYWVWPSDTQWIALLVSVLVAIPLLVTNGFYRTIFRYSGWPAMRAVIRTGMLYCLFYATVFSVVGVPGVPRTIGFIQPMLLFGMVGLSRLVIRAWLGGAYAALLNDQGRERVLIYGAGSAGRQLAAALADSSAMHVIGFIDDDSTLYGSLFNGKPIYPPTNIRQRTVDLGISSILLAVPSASRRRRNEIIAALGDAEVKVQSLPGVLDIVNGNVTVNDLRPLDVDDLLNRDTVPPNPILMSKNITGKTVLVTGAGGSIGSELCRQIIDLRPKRLLMVDTSEFALYTIHHELQMRIGERDDDAANDGSTAASDTHIIIPLLASVMDAQRMTSIVSTWAIDTVYHAAAYKHVPMVEHNPIEGVRNNVFGTLTLARIAQAHGVADFVLVSTDKAVRPTNIMGTTKRLAEMVLQSLDREGSGTRFSMVRFGNVLGSSGSVVPLFREQIRNGGPLTITHFEITRYFMTIPEAAQLVLQAGAMASGGEVFVLDMGEPIRILDLAKTMIRLSGRTVRSPEDPFGDIEIREVGLRPGEKLFEELLIGNDPSPTNHPRIMKAHEPSKPWSELENELIAIERAIRANDSEAVRGMLRMLVPEFSPERHLVDWVFLEQKIS